jgi:hypothetical protein
MKIVPGYPHVTKIINGGRYENPGTPYSPNGNTLTPEHNPVDINNPMDFPVPGDGQFVGASSEEIQQANLTQAMGLDSGDGRYGQASIDMNQASGCYDEPAKGGISYGNPNTGRASS